MSSGLARVDIKHDEPTLVPGNEDVSPHFLRDFKRRLRIRVVQMTDEQVVFDLVGIDAAIANAFRRVLISEVPTMAIESVYVWDNTSIIQDEVLAHRLGLIPIKVDPRTFDFKGPEDAATDANTIVMKLDATAKRSGGTVYSGALEWVPQGAQEERFSGDEVIKPVNDDIIVAKLKPGQAITLEAHCVKGIGADHAKFSPVCTASYRLLPQVTLKEKVTGELAEELREMCPLNVFDIEDIGGEKVAKAARSRDCTVCRQCHREPEWRERVALSRVPYHFVFSVESTGALPAKVLFEEAVKLLAAKCDTVQAALDGTGV